MTDTYRSFPILSPKPKATVYALDVFGQPLVQEVKLGCHGRIDPRNLAGNERGMGAAPFVAYSVPPGRKLWAMERTDYYARWLLILDGWNHPPLTTRLDRGVYSDPSMLKPLDRELDDYIRSSGVKVIGDYRDLSEPDYMVRRAAAEALHCKENKPDEARAIIERFEEEAQAVDADPSYWEMIRRQFNV